MATLPTSDTPAFGMRENRQYWALLILVALGLALGRAALMHWQAPDAWHAEPEDIARAFWMGSRFDLKYLAVLLGVPMLLLSFVSQLSASRLPWSVTIFRPLWRVWIGVIVLLVNLLMVCNYYYFQFYQGPINDLVFGLAEDDTQAILRTLYSEFPVVPLLTGIVGLSAAQLGLAFWWSRRLSLTSLTTRRAAAIMICSLVATVSIARGSFGTFPLRTMHLAVSRDAFTNHLVPSGLLALHHAWRDRQGNDLGDNPDAALAAYGFDDVDQAARVVAFGTHADDTGTPPDWRWRDQPTPTSLRHARRPHVVLAVMESWGRQLMDFDDPDDNDLLGRLRPWLGDGRLDYFSHALSSQNGTHPSLEALLLDTPITPLTQGRYHHVHYDTSVALPYRQAGYRTVYLTAGPESWRNMNTALPDQGFDEVLGEHAILARFPEATTHTWGVDDEWMFRYAEELLAEADASGQPLLLVMMSVTNHPPYRVPPHYTPAKLNVRRLGDALATDTETGLSILQTYQYANDALGSFLDALAARGLLDKMLFAATGDHQTRTIFAHPDDSHLHYKFGVPIVMRIPEPYRQGKQAHSEQWASHQDIFPTLWAHSLWGRKVPREGRDLYAQSDAPEAAFSFISDDALHGSGIVIGDAGAVVGLVNPAFYVWESRAQQSLKPASQPSPELLDLWQRARARMALCDLRIRTQAIGKPYDLSAANTASPMATVPTRSVPSS